MHVHEHIHVNRPRPEVYAFWRNFTQLPTFMEHLVAVEGDPNGITRWKAKSLTGTVDWEAKIVEDKRDELISWRSLDDSEVRNSGAVRFEDGPGGGTDVLVDISFDAPFGVLGVAVAKIFGDAPDQEIASDLKRFKEIIEKGQPMSRNRDETDQRVDDGRAELERSRDVTHATTNETPVEAVDAPIAGAPIAEPVRPAGVGIAGSGAAVHNDVVLDEPVTARPGSDSVANDLDPTRLGTSTGPDQDLLDGNDRDAAERDRSAPL